MGVKNKIKSTLRLFKQKKIVPILVPTQSDKLLKGRTAWIIGGSGGVGFAIAKAFVSAGAKVILSGTNEGKLASRCAELGDAARYVVIDMSLCSDFPQAVERAFGSFTGGVDILVNCAGVHHTLSFWEVNEEEYDRIMNANVKGPYFLSRMVARRWVENGIAGNILNISSSSDLRPAWGPYHLSKWALRGMTLGFAQQLVGHGIVVNAIAPGQTATPMLGVDASVGICNDNVVGGRYVVPEEVATLAVQMVSNAARMVVGSTLYVTGGSGIVSLEK